MMEEEGEAVASGTRKSRRGLGRVIFGGMIRGQTDSDIFFDSPKGVSSQWLPNSLLLRRVLHRLGRDSVLLEYVEWSLRLKYVRDGMPTTRSLWAKGLAIQLVESK